MGFRESYNHTVGALSDIRERQEKASKERDYGSAFATGGWDAVGRVAGERGDFTTATSAGNNAWTNEQRQTQRTTAERTETQRRQAVLANVLNHIKPLPYEQRRERIQQLRPRLLQEGFPEQMVDSYDPTDEKINGDLAVAGQLTDYAKIEQDEAGRWVGQTRDGRVVPIEGAPSPVTQRTLTPQEAEGAGFRGGSVVQQAPDGSYKVVQAPREFSPSQLQPGGDHAQWRTMAPEEVEAAGLPPGTVAQVDERTGSIKTIRAQRQYTEYAGKAANFANRMNASNQTLTQLERAGVDPKAVYVFGMGDRNAQLYRQAQRDFVTAVLRQESGAAIADSEFASARQLYFPVPGDPPAVIEAKRQARVRAIQGMQQQSQGAYEEWFGGGGAQPQGGQGAGGADSRPPPPNTTPGSGPTRSFNTMPPAAQFQGRTVTDSSTGKRYRSDGRQWTEVR